MFFVTVIAVKEDFLRVAVPGGVGIRGGGGGQFYLLFEI